MKVNAADILAHAEQHDIHLRADGDQLLLDAPKDALTQDLRETLKQHKPALLDLLRNRGLTEDQRADIQEHLEERSAIMECDGGLSRREAEHQAKRNLRVYRYRLADNPDSWLIFLSPGSDLDEATRLLERQFGVGRVLEVRTHK